MYYLKDIKMHPETEYLFKTESQYTGKIKLDSRGFRAGYIYIPNTHPFYGNLSDENAEIDKLEVHGGITYSSKNCVGFDCNHFYDFVQSRYVEYDDKYDSDEIIEYDEFNNDLIQLIEYDSDDQYENDEFDGFNEYDDYKYNPYGDIENSDYIDYNNDYNEYNEDVDFYQHDVVEQGEDVEYKNKFHYMAFEDVKQEIEKLGHQLRHYHVQLFEN